MSDYFADAIKAKEDSLEHHGVLGQKWGVRRFQNADGSLTAAGKRRVYAQGANYGGYESFRHRHRRAIEAAKYENDLKKNQKKLDKAYEKGSEKKIAKYTKAEEMLTKNREIYVKDLSPEAIQMGRDYITQMKAGMIGTLIGGPIGGAAAGLGVRAVNKMADTEKKVYAQEAERKRLRDEMNTARKELNDWSKAHSSEPYEGELAKEGDRLIENDIRARSNLHNYNVDQQRRAGGNAGPKVYVDTGKRAQDAAKKEVEKAKRAWVDYQAQDPEEHSNLYSQQLAKDYQDKKRAYDEKYKKN